MKDIGIKESKIKEFQTKILAWYGENARVFPWREKELSAFEVIVTEVLLQRTKAETVSKYYNKFFEKFNSWDSIVQTNTENLEKVLQPLGLYRQKAKRLYNLAIEMQKRNYIIPYERTELEKMPFLGQYIANATELILFKSHKPLLDVNMARVLERYFGKRKLADIRYDPYLQELALKIVKHSESLKLNWGILDFAALICTARSPNCLQCPLNDNCKYFNNFVI